MKVELSPYSPEWPRLFEQEKSFLLPVIGQWLAGGVEHVGSTAVPGLSAKPIIDIMFGVDSLEKSRPAIPALEKHGYCYHPYKNDAMHWFCKPSPTFRTHHLHLVPYQSPLWRQRIRFRDILRSHPQVAREYETLKRELAARHANDREAYTQAKTTFITKALKLYGDQAAG